MSSYARGEFGGVAPGRRGRILFGRMYEDAEIERTAFGGKGRVFAIASAGCTAIALSGGHEVVACDINPVQLEYARRRAQGGRREVGSAERVMTGARRAARAAGWSERRLREFVGMRDPAAQIRYWREHLDTWRFRTGFDLLISRRWLRLVYSRELLGFLPDKFGRVLRERLERGFARHANAENPWVRAMLLGELEEDSESRGNQIEFVLGDAAAYLERCAAGSFEGFALSNILDGAAAEYRERLWRAVRRAGAPGAVVVRRSFGEPSGREEENRAAADRAMLWGVVEVRQA